MGSRRLILFILLFMIVSVDFIFSMGIKTSEGVSGKDILIDKNQQDVPSFQNRYNVIEDKVEDEPKKFVQVSPLALGEDDLLWDFAKDGSYVDLFIRKKPKINSVMLTNMYYGSEYSSKYGSNVYGIRTQKPNPVNSYEMRVINKKKVRNKGIYNFIVDSTPERHRVFGLAYRLRIPRLVEYGYKALGVSHGLIALEKGVTFNLRSYARKYADNGGSFYNNPVHIDFTAKSYYEKLRPKLTQLSSHRSGSYNVVVVQYKSRINYVKNFLLRDFQKSTFFRKIEFVVPSDNGVSDRDKKSLVLRAIRDKGGYVHITALIYLKDTGVEQEYNIAAIDEENRLSKNYLSVIMFPSKEKADSKMMPKGDIIIIDNAKGSFEGEDDSVYFSDN